MPMDPGAGLAWRWECQQAWHPGPHPWLQHVVVTQCPGLAGEFALIPGVHPRVARDPVHRPWEALEEVGAMVVGSTLLLAEGQGCKRGKGWSGPLCHCSQPLLLALHTSRLLHRHRCPPQTAREGSGRIKLLPATAGTVSTSLVPTLRPVSPAPQRSVPMLHLSQWGSPGCCRSGSGCGGLHSTCRHSGGWAECSPGRRSGHRPHNSESRHPTVPRDPSHQPVGPAEAQNGRVGYMRSLLGSGSIPTPQAPPPSWVLTLKSCSWSMWRQRPPMQACEGPQGVPSAQGECLVWHMA